MNTIKNLYILISTVVFTFGYPVWGRTPATWMLSGIEHLLKVIH